ncbi:bifunctional adenosylcobinamide kinase/adenosylcobinamide-phosphate guanylyltransferase [Acidovorax sp. sic0104]|uniref:bifunctional adenosylcobinamide kinase/adenosylcobinamide-phosphate guanylyltransferase n=1 Tax=Acidovorax sp. sic0104 TaxID=2854784 RepID=UPI002107F67E|nr:bifunctional adenosylcobinamide kinase/adenosylcobinamide-phosphate guanylyltransferase [Acidovorax sp. sic0104]
MTAMSAQHPSKAITTELILGGQKSGKSRRAELLARDWLAQSADHRAVLIATGQAWDDEMRERIERHQRDRAERVPGLVTVEEPLDVASAIAQRSTARTLLVVDCLTLWLTQWTMPLGAESMNLEQKQALSLNWQAQVAMFLGAIAASPGPIILVGNEIGLGVIPLGREVRAFVDALGALNQQVAQVCPRVTLMAAGLPLTLKEPAA